MEVREQKLTISGIRKYLDEWFAGTMSMGLLIDGRDDAFRYVIVETTKGDVVFETIFNKFDYKGEDETICSTAGIVNEELRGMVEKCILLDKQMAESNEEKQNNASQKS